MIQRCADKSFVHGRTVSSDMARRMDAMEQALYSESHAQLNFRGITLHTGAKGSSIISFSLYKHYCTEYKVPFRLKQIPRKEITGIREK